jgi:hypothetical protein
MRKRVVGVVLALSTAGSVALLMPHAASRAPMAKVPTCVRVPLHNPVIPDAQIQIGYCP